MVKKFKTILLIGLAVRLGLLLISAYHPDLGNHIDWGNRFWQYGPKNFYSASIWSVSQPNQPIGSILLFAAISKINQAILSFTWFINTTVAIFPSNLVHVLEAKLHVWLVKLPFILAELALASFIFQFLRKKNPKKALLATSLFLFNPALIYNSTVWGQTDSLVNLLSVAGLLLVFQKKYTKGIILFLSSFLFKLSLIIYLPVFIILLLQRQKDLKKTIKPFLISLGLFVVLSLPFSWPRNPFRWLWQLYYYRVLNNQGSMLNGNAINIWLIGYGVDLTRNENVSLFFFTAKTWGRLFFSLTLIPIFLKLKNKPTANRLLVTSLIIAFSAFMLLTNMHERYLYPIFPLLAILIGLKSKIADLKDYLILSFLHLLNLYNLWFYPYLPLRPLLEASNFLLPRLMAIVLLYYYLKFFIKYLKHET